MFEWSNCKEKGKSIANEITEWENFFAFSSTLFRINVYLEPLVPTIIVIKLSSIAHYKRNQCYILPESGEYRIYGWKVPIVVFVPSTI